jgi:hypothetical protein
MRPGTHLAEVNIRVPGPFAGVDELGFSVRYPEQSLFAPLRDVPLWIEGPEQPIRRLAHRLRMLHALVDESHPYAWTDPVQLADEVVIVAFRDRSPERDAAQAFGDYFANLVRPVAFPFLIDCARVAHLRLADRIEIEVEAGERSVARFALTVGQIVAENGYDLLSAA